MVEQAIAELTQRAAEQMRANIRTIADGIYCVEGASSISDGVVDEPLTIALTVTKTGEEPALRLHRLQPALHAAR